MDNIDANNNLHPPACTCQDCVQARLGRLKRLESSNPRFRNNNTKNKVFAPAKLNRQLQNKEVEVKRRPSLKKLSLNLLVIVCLTVAVWIGYRLFYLHKFPAVIGSILFIADIIILIWSIVLLRTIQYKTKAPGFLATIASVLAVFLVLAFAGVEPVSAAKDNVVTWIGMQTASITKTINSSQPAKRNTPTTGLSLSSDYSKTYPAYEQDLGGGLKLYSKVPIPPPIKVWNYEVKWTTRTVYVVKATKKVDGVTITGFWEVDGDRWVFRNSELFLSYKNFGNIQVSNAPAYEIR